MGNDLFFYFKIIPHIITYQYGKIILAIFKIGLIVTIYFVVKNFKDSFSKIKNSRIQMYKWDVSSKIM